MRTGAAWVRTRGEELYCDTLFLFERRSGSVASPLFFQRRGDTRQNTAAVEPAVSRAGHLGSHPNAETPPHSCLSVQRRQPAPPPCSTAATVTHPT